MTAPTQDCSTTTQVMEVENDESATGFGCQNLDYKTMTSILKCLVKQTDSVQEKVGDMSLKFGEQLSKLATVIDPEVNSILYKKGRRHPDFLSLSQQRATPLEDVDKKFQEMSDALDARAAAKWANEPENENQMQMDPK